MQDGEEADLCAEVFGIGADGLQRFCSGVEEDVINYLLVLVGDGSNLVGHSEDDMEVRAVKQFSQAMLDPLCPGQRLAFWAVPIPARVEAVAFVIALIAALEMTAEDGSAAHFDGRHDAPLFAGHRGAMRVPIEFTIAAEHIRHFQCGALHGPAPQKTCGAAGWGLTATGCGSKSRGLVAEHTLLVATRR